MSSITILPVQSLLEDVVEEHRTLFPDVKLVWKTQNPGGCARLPKPGSSSSLLLFSLELSDTYVYAP